MRVRVILEHISNYPNPVQFGRGDRLTLGRHDTEYEGWVWVTTLDGNEGWAPEEFLDVVSDNAAVANREYCAWELTTKLGQYLFILSEVNGWYWAETESGDKGWVPKSTVA